MANQEELMIRCISIANRKYDGHLTIMKFTTNWKVCFGTPNDRDDIQNMVTGLDLTEALLKLYAKELSHEM